MAAAIAVQETLYEAFGEPETLTDRRSYRRSTTVLRGGLFCGGTLIDGTILDISLTGAKMQVRDEAPVGTDVMLALAGSVHFSGEVIWRQGETVGVRFHKQPEKIAEVMAGMLPDSCLHAAHV